MKHTLLPVCAGLMISANLAAAPVARAQTIPDVLSGGLRLKATFESGKPELDAGGTEKRLSRIWFGRDYSRAPDNTLGNRLALGELLEAGHNSKYSFATKTDVGIRATGTLNTQSGTLSGWFRKSEVFEKGGLLLAAKAWPTGGLRGTIHWALGIGGAPNSDVPAKKLFLVADGVQAISATDLPAGDWVHLAAVWDAAHGAKLYANGQLISSRWSQNPEEANGLPSTPAVFPAGNFVDEMVKWRASQGNEAGRKLVPLLDAGQFPGVKVSRVKSETSDDKTPPEVLKLEMTATERLQIRSLTPAPLTKGEYNVLIRLRRDTQASGAGSATDVTARISIRSDKRTAPETVAVRPVAGTPVDQIHLAAKLTTNEGDGITFDINFNKPGVYYIESLGVYAAEQGKQAGREATNLKLPGGVVPVVARSTSYPVERFHLMPAEGGAIDDLAVYDLPLNAQAVALLFAGKEPEYSMAEATQPDNAARLVELGWAAMPTSGLIPLTTGKNLNVQQATIKSAKENLRAAGWLAVDGFPASQSPWGYHGYIQGVQKTVHLAFEEGPLINYITAQGTFSGTLEEGNSLEPEKNPLLKLQPGGFSFRRFLDKPLTAQAMTLRHEQGLLDEIGFYSINEDAAAENAGPALRFQLQPARSDVPLRGVKREEFISAYHVRDRSTLVGVSNTDGRTATVAIPALQTFHLMTPALAEEFALGAIEVRLRAKNAANSARLRLVAHDAITPWRELARLDFALRKDGPEFNASLTLDLRDTLIRKGDVVWLSLISDAPLEIITGADSTLSLKAVANAGHATKLWRDWELNSVRDRFESLSEPRAWYSVGPEKSSSWWLAAAAPEYEWLDNSLRVLRERFPNDETIRSWFAFTHPNTSNPAVSLPLPESGTHPRWAVLLRENLRLYKQFVNYWIDNRRHPNGEWGNVYADDTDLLQDWVDAALISDPDGRIANSFTHSADAIWNTFKLNDGRRIIENGLNNRYTDLLHAYEEGLNIQPQAFLLDYGDPEVLSRLMATAARYDGYLMTPPQNGKRQFVGSGKPGVFFSSTQPPTGHPEDGKWFLFTHQGLLISWYNGHPATQKILREVGDGLLDASLRRSDFFLGYGGTAFYNGLYRMTGDARYLSTLLNVEQLKNGVLAPRHTGPMEYSLFERLNDYDRKKTFDWLQQDEATRFATLATEDMGSNDTRFEKNWAQWYLTRDKKYLNAGLEQLYRKLKYILPSLTEAEQSGDRVAITKQLISMAYLGGVPSARNRFFYPDFAVSYEKLSDNFAALVTENKTDALQVVFYNFEEQPQNGAMKVWNLAPGKYEFIAGPDADGDDKIDKVESTQQYSLVRGDSIPLSLPAKRTWIMQGRLLEKSTPLHERADAAISSKLLRRVGSTLTVPVFNTGSKPIARLKVRLSSADGKQRQERIIENLSPASGWKLASQEVQFSLSGDKGPWEIELDPDGELEEITRNNNRAFL